MSSGSPSYTHLKQKQFPSSDKAPGCSGALQTSTQGQKKCPHFKIHLAACSELPSHLQLKVRNLLLGEAEAADTEGKIQRFPQGSAKHWLHPAEISACGLVSVFGNAYLCEKTFSKMKCVKSYYRSALTGKYLQLMLTIGSTKYKVRQNVIPLKRIQLFSLADLYF